MKKIFLSAVLFLLSIYLNVYGEGKCDDYKFVSYMKPSEYKEKFDICKKECDEGSLKACANLSEFYIGGYGVKKDYKKALKLTRKTCKKNIGFGCNNFGYLYMYGLGVEKSYKKAFELYKKACDLNEPAGCYNLAYLYYEGLGVEKNYKKAFKLYKKACDLNEPAGCYNLAYLYQYGLGVDKNYKKAFKLYKKACDLNEPTSCYNLGYFYRKGLGVERNYKKAFELYKKSCKLGEPFGCNGLGYLYEHKLGVERNYKKAFELYKKACDLGNPTGCSNLGYLYNEGLGVEKNYKKAFKLYKKACDLNEPAGCYNLAYLYQYGLGVDKNYKKAFKLYKKACDLNEPSGCYNLAYLYQYGLGVDKNSVKAFLYSKKSCDLYFKETGKRDNDACFMLSILDYDEKEIHKYYKAPSVKLVSVRKLNNDYAVVKVRIYENGVGIGSIKIYINNVIVKETNYKQLKENGKIKKERNYYLAEIKVPLTDIKNNIKIYIFDKHNLVKSSPVKTKVVLENIEKPSLYAVVIGIGKFKNKYQLLELKYADEDAKEFAYKLKKIAKPLYKNVEIILLTEPEETTKKYILGKINEIKKKIKPKDTFVFFIVSHGELLIDTNGKTKGLYILTSETESLSSRKLKKTSISDIELMDILKGLNISKKLVIIDTCHSGSLKEKMLAKNIMYASRGLVERQIIEKLNKLSGAICIYASNPLDLAYEGYKNHGVLTYTILEAMDKDPDGDGYIKAKEIAEYVEEQAPKIANKIGKIQYPQTEIEGEDFHIGKHLK